MTTLLCDDFFVIIDNSKYEECSVRLTLNYLTYQLKRKCNAKENNNLISMSVNDMIGCHVMRSRPVNRFYCYNTNEIENENTAFICIYSYTYKTKEKFIKSTKETRISRKTVYFVINKFDSLRENIALGEKWQNAMLWLIKGLSVNLVNITITESRPKARQLLAFVNPISGAGKAMQIFEQKVVPLMCESDTQYNLIVTEEAKSAQNLIANNSFDLEKYDAIIVIAGDGLLFEIINGIMKRNDWENAIKIPIGIIPGGSGNGLAHSINFAILNDINCNAVMAATLNVVRGKEAPMDLVRVKTKDEIIYSFLSIGWGLMADVDIESEHLRILGEIRFTLWALFRVLATRKYRGRVSYKPISLKNNHNDSNRVDHDADLRKNTSQGSCDNESTHLISEDESQSNEWIVIDGDFINVYASYQTHLNSGVFFVPDARLNDGIIWLLMIRDGVSRAQVLRFLTSLETGGHVNLPYVQMVPVTAFKLEPANNEGNIMIDGELIECGPIEAEIMPSYVRILKR